ncbi:hypothetical protein [Candidatus Villigracilis saccharophilus]|uniref:hypothetical protein n=1 Tax=Candidatus Villigracilis saccharophilus TaxID=3140684 RepID=UPI0031356960|nr:hypothetical protein [Anaerolineales bacterium]
MRWKDISIVFQGAMNALNPVRIVGDQIAEAIIKHMPGFPRDQRLQERVVELLDLVGIAADHGDDYPHQYSGRHAPARDDRHGAGLQPANHHCR